MKVNQVQALKELKQEYEILRNLPIDDQVLDSTSHVRRNTTSIYSSESENVSEISSSKQSRQKVKGERETHILEVEKKQLEMVVGNSMRKIEELLMN